MEKITTLLTAIFYTIATILFIYTAYNEPQDTESFVLSIVFTSISTISWINFWLNKKQT